MHYLYILEGRLKYETISFDSEVVFNLYNKNADKKADDSHDDDLTYFLKSDVDVVITVNLASNKISLSAPISQTIYLFDQIGGFREVKDEREITLAQNTVKFRIANIDFAFLINAMTDPEIIRVSEQTGLSGTAPETSRFNFGLLSFGVLNKKTILVAFTMAISLLIIFFWLLGRTSENIFVTPSIVFQNENELMRANLQTLNSNEILVKTQLLEQIRLYLEQQGHSYVRFDLEKQQNGKFNLLLSVFANESQSFDSVVNKFYWVSAVVVRVIDIRQMIDDFNRIADKYGLNTIDRNQTSMLHQLIEVSFVNNNLKFDSLQRDLHTFYERWGRNYIEFNVSLKKHQDLPVDFILRSSGEEVIKSDQGFYIN